MLNSLQMQLQQPTTTDQFALKFKSMFNLAIQQHQQRYAHHTATATHFPLQNDYEQASAFSLNHQHQRCSQQNFHRTPTVTPPPPQTSIFNSIIPVQKKIRSEEEDNSETFHMEEEEDRESKSDDMRYNNSSCSSEVSKTTEETGNSSSMTNLENTTTMIMSHHINYNNNLIGGSAPSFDQQHLSFMNNPTTRRRACGGGGGGSGGSDEGKQKGKKQGPLPSGNKTPFSIESLLAHSNNWRRNQNHPDFNNPESGGRSAAGKDARFLPYVIPHQSQEQNIRTSSRQGSPDERRAGKPSVVSIQQQHSENDKRPESHEGTNGSKSGGNGRRAGKSKRVRTIFTPEQLERLEAEFERQQYMVGPERLYLASSLYLTEAQVKVWFQNRRIKWRKQHLEMEQQRLAIYRTLAEQDMTSSVEDDDQEEEDSVDCEYEGDVLGNSSGVGCGGGVAIVEDDERSVHSPSSSSSSRQIQQQHPHPHPHQPPLPHPHPLSNMNMFSPISENKQDPLIRNSHSHSSASAVAPSSTQFKAHSHSHINKISSSSNSDPRFPPQGQSPNIIDEYDCSLTNSSSTSSPSSSSRGTTTTTMTTTASHNVVIQAGNKK